MRRAAAPPALSGVAARSVAETAKLVEAVRRSGAELGGVAVPPPAPPSSYSSYYSSDEEDDEEEPPAPPALAHSAPPAGFGARLFALSLAETEEPPPQQAQQPPRPRAPAAAASAEAAAAEAAAWLQALRLDKFCAPLAELGAAAVVDFPEARPARATSLSAPTNVTSCLITRSLRRIWKL